MAILGKYRNPKPQGSPIVPQHDRRAFLLPGPNSRATAWRNCPQVGHQPGSIDQLRAWCAENHEIIGTYALRTAFALAASAEMMQGSIEVDCFQSD
jgi:hypothetical protein